MASTKFIQQIANNFVDSRIFSENALKRYGLSEAEARAKAILAGATAKRTFRQPTAKRENIDFIPIDRHEGSRIAFHIRDMSLPPEHGLLGKIAIDPPIGNSKLFTQNVRAMLQLHHGVQLSRSAIIPQLAGLIKDINPEAKRLSLRLHSGNYPSIYPRPFQTARGKRFALDIQAHNPAKIFDVNSNLENIARPPMRYLLKLAEADMDHLKFIGSAHPKFREGLIHLQENPAVAEKIGYTPDIIQHQLKGLDSIKELTVPIRPEEGRIREVSDISFPINLELNKRALYRSEVTPPSFSTRSVYEDKRTPSFVKERSHKAIIDLGYGASVHPRFNLAPIRAAPPEYIIDINKAIRESTPYVVKQNANPISFSFDSSPQHRDYGPYLRPHINETIEITGEVPEGPVYFDLGRRPASSPVYKQYIGTNLKGFTKSESQSEVQQIVSRILKKRYFKE